MTVLLLAGTLFIAVTIWFIARPLASGSLTSMSQRHELEVVRDRLLAQMNELDAERADQGVDHQVAQDEELRLSAELADVLSRYSSADERLWVQEEPRNMGAWTFVRDRLESIFGDKHPVGYAGRVEAASPAAGSPRIHRAQLQAFLDEALGED